MQKIKLFVFFIILLFPLKSYSIDMDNLKNIKLFDEDNNSITINSFKNDNFILIFAATWCKECFITIKNLNENKKLFEEKNIKIIIVSEDFDNADKMIEYFNENEYNFTLYHDKQMKLLSFFNKKYIPSYILFTKNLQLYHDFNNILDFKIIKEFKS